METKAEITIKITDSIADIKVDGIAYPAEIAKAFGGAMAYIAQSMVLVAGDTNKLKTGMRALHRVFTEAYVKRRRRK